MLVTDVELQPGNQGGIRGRGRGRGMRSPSHRAIQQVRRRDSGHLLLAHAIDRSTCGGRERSTLQRL